MRVFRALAGFVVMAVVAAILGSIVHSQVNVSDLVAAGAEIPIGDRIGMALFDIMGMGPLYGIILSIGFLIAIPTSALLLHFVTALQGLRSTVYIVAGFVSVIVTMQAVNIAFFEIHAVSSTRTVMGLVAHGVVGGIAGWCFAMISGGNRDATVAA